jgi:integrase/recombinase XerD
VDGSLRAPASINQALATIQSFFEWLARKCYIQSNPTLSVKKLTEPPTDIKDLEVSVVQQHRFELLCRGERYFRDRAIFEDMQ